MSIDFKIRDFFYPGKIWSLRRQFDRNQWLDPDEASQYQIDRLKAVLVHAGRRVPYYRDLFRKLRFNPADLSSTSQLAQLPTLSKDMIQERPSLFLADNASQYKPTACTTSGSSGKPLHFYLDRSSQALEFVYYWRYWGWAGYSLGSSFAELTSHFFLVRKQLTGSPTCYQPLFRRLLLNGNQISPRGASAMADALLKHRVKYLKGVASALYFLALQLQRGGRTDFELEAVFSTGEVVTDMHRKLISKVFGAPVLDSYGHMERTVAVCQCPEGGFHINTDYGLLEVEDSGCKPSNGVRLGRVIGTGLHNMAMPLIRYEVGDEVEVFEGERACPCGRTFPLLKALHGRSEDVLVTPDGCYITALFIVPEFVRGVRFVQFVQTAPEVLELRVIPSREGRDTGWNDLLEYTRRVVGPLIRLEVRKVEESELMRDPSGKVRPVIAQPQSAFCTLESTLS